MGSSVGNKAQDERRPATPAALALLLLTHEAGAQADAAVLAAAGARAYTKLRAQLVVFLGQTGFDALWHRAMYLARQAFPWWDEAAAEPPDMLPHGLHAALQGRDAATAKELLVAALASFVALLWTFIGENLGVRLIYQTWPDLPPPTAGVEGEEATL